MTAHHNAASALPVKQNGRISARRRGSKENGVVGAQRHDEANHSIHLLWKQAHLKLVSWRRGMAAALGPPHAYDFVVEEQT
jgi:hypothetical protein